MKKNKLALLGMVSALLVGTLAACGGKEAAAESTTAAAAAQTAEAEAAGAASEAEEAKDGAEEKETEAADGGMEITTVKVGTGCTYYPFSYLDGEEKKGFEIDVWNEIGKRSGFDVEFVQAAYSGLYGLLDKGDIDTIANQVSVNEEREKKYLFSVPYCYCPLKIIVPKGNPENVQTLDDLEGMTVVGSINGSELKILEDHLKGKAEILTSQGGSFSFIVSGKAYATVQDIASTAVTIKDQGLPLEIVGEPLAMEINSYPFVRNEKGEALQKLADTALTEMHEDGTLSELANKWFGYDISVEG